MYYSKDATLMLQKYTYISTVEKDNFIVITREMLYHESMTNNNFNLSIKLPLTLTIQGKSKAQWHKMRKIKPEMNFQTFH